MKCGERDLSKRSIGGIHRSKLGNSVDSKSYIISTSISAYLQRNFPQKDRHAK